MQQESKQFEVFDGERYIQEGHVSTKKTIVMAKKTAKFGDNRSQLVNMIKASQRLEGKPTYGLAEKMRDREEKEAEAFGPVQRLVKQHESMNDKICRFFVQ